jgi:phage baseplate assembly protein W
MLTITDFEGVDLVQTPPEERQIQVVGQRNAVIAIQARVIESDPYLASDYVNGTLSWNDGTLPIVYDTTSGTLTVDVSKGLPAGKYVISLSGRNWRAPVYDNVRVNFPFDIVQTDTDAAPPHLIFGPILPRDTGNPGPLTWSLDTRSDLLILESSVKMLLLTAKGERLAEPEYGTDVRKLIFQPNIPGIENQIQEMIIQALNTWEPRLQLQSIDIVRDEERAVTVNIVLLSKQSTQSFMVNLRYVI